MTARFGLVSLALGLLLAGPAGADYPDWESVAEVSTIEILTHDEDGDLRETTIWFVLLGGEPHLRTADSRWLQNIRRDPNVGFRIEGQEYEAAAREVTSDEMIEKVNQALREKYGWGDRFVRPLRYRNPRILRVSPRAPGS